MPHRHWCFQCERTHSAFHRCARYFQGVYRVLFKRQKKASLCRKLKHLLCLIIDERSLLTSKLLGTTTQVISETIFDGSNIDEPIGGLPVLLLVGDDYQLPGITEGAIEARDRYNGTKMTQRGRSIFVECAKTVFKLSVIRRVQDNKQEDRDLMQRVRKGTCITDEDVLKLQSLHLDNIGYLHGLDTVKKIKSKAVYLFWTNEKRLAHNMEQLQALNSEDNPTAIVRPHSRGDKFGKSINGHFDGEMPKASLLCRNSKVCLQGHNFMPLWGLHNGACGTVQEIVFATGESPNTGNHPIYVVVKIPQYKGPAWDTNHITVSSS